MRYRRNKSRLCSIQFFKLRNVFQPNHISPEMYMLFPGFGCLYRNILCLKITFFIICINFKRFAGICRSHQFPDQTTQQIIFQGQFGSSFPDHVFPFQIQHRQSFVVGKQYFPLFIQPQDRLMNTIDNPFDIFFSRENIRQYTLPVFGQFSSHIIK